jgi:hypothetical protein
MSDQPTFPDADGTPGSPTDDAAADAETTAESRRRFLKKAAVTGAFVVPVVLSVSLDGTVIKQATAMAAGSDTTPTQPPPPPVFGPNVIGDPGFNVP